MNPEVLAARKWYWWLWLSPVLTIPTLIVCFVSFPDSLYTYLGNLVTDSPLASNYGFYPVLECLIGVILIVGSALWHLILLVPALNRQSEFVRWHGRQALLLGGVRTAIPAAFMISSMVAGWDSETLMLSVSVLMAVWFFGTRWGQRQAGRGECTLMRLTGHSAGLPLPTDTGRDAAAPAPAPLSRERWDHRAAYDRGLVLLAQGQTAKAAPFFYTLLVSDASPEFKARVAQELKQISGIDENATPDVLVAIFRFSRDPEQQHTMLATLDSLRMVEAL